jgi:hypothetical protein
MMRLVVQYSVGDGCSWYAENTVPVVYESAEAFLVDFEEIVKPYMDKNSSRYYAKREFVLGGQQFDCSDFFFEGKYQAPDVMTVDEWFDEVGVE